MALDLAFPTPIWTEKCTEDFSKLNYFTKFITENNNMVALNKSGKTILSRCLDTWKLFEIKEILNKKFQKFCTDILKAPKEMEVAMTTSWLTSTKQGGSIGVHRHMNNWYAGLLYFDSDYAGASALQLHNPLMSCTSFAPDVQPLFNVNQGIQIPPTHNLLVFFPAYLYHATSVQESTDTRHSLAFNFIPKRCGMTIDDFGTSDSQYDIEWLSS
tara:strand:- start:150 stop:791 length:642 start_codon:yes stop_codon:yes gene_type:complete